MNQLTETEKQELRVRLITVLDYDHDPMHGPLNAQWKHRKTGERHTNEWFDRFFYDLNACAEGFEKGLTGDDKLNYVNQLYFVTFTPGQDRDYGVVFSTATQRCLAFVKTMEEREEISVGKKSRVWERH